jgi:hypothetical protein
MSENAVYVGYAQKRRQAVAASAGPPREELSSRPDDVAADVGPHPHFRPLLGEGEEGFGVDPGQPLGRQIADQVAKREKLQMYDHSFWAKGGGPIIFAAISAIEMALWDINGKVLGVPVYM